MEITEGIEEGSGASAAHQTMQISNLNILRKDKRWPMSELQDDYDELQVEYREYKAETKKLSKQEHGIHFSTDNAEHVKLSQQVSKTKR